MDQKVFPFEPAMVRSESELRAIPLFHRLWPPLLIATGLVLTGVWIGLIGYGSYLLICAQL